MGESTPHRKEPAMSPETKNRLLVFSLILTAAACEPPAPGPTGPPAPAPLPPPVVGMAPSAPTIVPMPAAPAPPPIGLQDPFARPGATAARALETGWRAMRKKDYDEARAAFHAVV